MRNSNTDMLNRSRGALVGLACGDALGTTLEFKQPGTFERLVGIEGGGPFNLKPGQWTDDTSMALCLAASYITTGRCDPAGSIAALYSLAGQRLYVVYGHLL